MYVSRKLREQFLKSIVRSNVVVGQKLFAHVRGISNAIFKGAALAQDSKYDPNINASNRKLFDAQEVPQ